MTIKESFRGRTVEVSGTTTQCEEYLEKWRKQISEEPYNKLTELIRESAIKLDIPGAKHLPTIELLELLLSRTT